MVSVDVQRITEGVVTAPSGFAMVKVCTVDDGQPVTLYFDSLQDVSAFGQSLVTQARALMPQANPLDIWGRGEASRP